MNKDEARNFLATSCGMTRKQVDAAFEYLDEATRRREALTRIASIAEAARKTTPESLPLQDIHNIAIRALW
jgi:hypothetical protein